MRELIIDPDELPNLSSGSTRIFENEIGSIGFGGGTWRNPENMNEYRYDEHRNVVHGNIKIIDCHFIGGNSMVDFIKSHPKEEYIDAALEYIMTWMIKEDDIATFLKEIFESAHKKGFSEGKEAIRREFRILMGATNV